jgi:N-acetylglucosamine-6-phosphate deacetylase
LCKKSSGLNAFLISTITSPRENSKQTNKQTASTKQKQNKQEESKQKTWEI